MVKRKPTDPGEDAPAVAAGPEPAVPYDAAEWDRRLLAARERRAKILALRGAGGNDGPLTVPALPVGGLFSQAEGLVPPAMPGHETLPPRPDGPAGPAESVGSGFEGRMDRIARAMEAARQRKGDTTPAMALPPASAPAAGPGSAPASPSPSVTASVVESGLEPGRRPAPDGLPAAEPLRRAVARAPAAVRAQPVPAAETPVRSRLVPALALGVAAAIGLAGGAYLLFGRTAGPGAGAVILTDLGGTDLAVGAPLPTAGRAPDLPGARVPDVAPGPLPALDIAAIPGPLTLPLASDVPARPPSLAAISIPAAAVPSPDKAASGISEPEPRPTATDPDGGAPIPTDPAALPEGVVAGADPAFSPPPAEPVVADPAAFRVRVNAPASAPAAEVDAIGATLAGAGFPGLQAQRVGFTVSRTHLRYYNAEDAAAAQAIGARLGAEARDFTGYRPKPPVGTIEVWIAGAASDGAARPRRTAPPKSGGLPNPVEAAKNIGQAVKTLVETFPANEQR